MKIPISRHGVWTSLVCIILLAGFAISSYRAVPTKNATIDKPTSAMSGWLELCRGDFHVETVTPPLCKMWAAIPKFFASPRLIETWPVWDNPFWNPAAEVAWSMQVFYDTPGFDADAFLNQSGQRIFRGFISARKESRSTGK